MLSLSFHKTNPWFVNYNKSVLKVRVTEYSLKVFNIFIKSIN